MVRVPIAGRIAAGRPIDAIADSAAFLTFPREMVGDDAYALEVRGESMVEDHILDGDVVLVRPQPTVENGEIARPVHEITVAGNLREMFLDIAALGDDVDRRGAIHCGSLLVGEMTIAGD